jgi:2-oxoglutarate ferredoxin oxidoreductase subunit alpha
VIQSLNLKAVRVGEYFESGDVACAEGAIAAGCRFFAGYPITPSTEIAEHLAARLPQVGGSFIQMEDELASIAAVIGASYTGLKTMTATSGPGFSLMTENVGLAVMTEAPCVIVNIMRVGPSTGQPTRGAQGDVMQARWGSHGDFEIIALAPNSVQEMFDLTIEAFNLAERYRVPVILLADENIGHLHEKLVIPLPSDIMLVNRKKPTVLPADYFPFQVTPSELVPPMACFGEGYRFHATGLTHDKRGYPDSSDATQLQLVTRLCDKIRKNANKITRIEKIAIEDADVIVVAYGSPSRAAIKTVRMARAEGIKAGLLRLITLWPFPDQQIQEIAQAAKAIVMVEMNNGQLVREVKRAVCPTPVLFIPKPFGTPHTPSEILEKVRKGIK